MAVLFEFDPAKAESNRRKHGVTFEEATTVFYDPLASTLADDQHSYDEVRLITVCVSDRNRLLFVVYTEIGYVIRLIEPVLPPRSRENNMKTSTELDSLAPRPNLDFSKGERGRHIERLKQGSNIVLIAPDLLDTFPDSESVNAALRSLKQIAARSVRPPARKRKAATVSQ